MPIAHRYTLPDTFYAVSVNFTNTQPGNSTLDPLPAKPWPKKWPQYGAGWQMAEDHRERKFPYFAEELWQKATDFWLPSEGDDWQSPPRTMKDPGPLPAGHRLTRPVKPLSTAKADKLREIDAGYDAALVAALTMPAASPTPITVAMETSALLAIDPDAVDSIRAVLDARRAGLRAQVEAVSVIAPDDPADADAVDAATATAVATVEAVAVNYPV